MTVNLEHLKELKEILGEEFPDVLTIYLKDSRHRLSLALDSLRQANWERARAEFHTLKGSSANVGAMQFSGMCQHLEWQLKKGECPSAQMFESELELEYQRVAGALNQLIG